MEYFKAFYLLIGIFYIIGYILSACGVKLGAAGGITLAYLFLISLPAVTIKISDPSTSWIDAYKNSITGIVAITVITFVGGIFFFIIGCILDSIF